MVHTTCAALHCLSSSHSDKDLKFHQFPHDAQRRKIWVTACKRTDVIDKDWDYFKYKYLCSKHFHKCMYSKKDRLKKLAVPSLHLAEKPLQHDSSTQTVESIQYTNQQSENYVSLLYVMPNVEKDSTTTHTQTEESLPYDIKHVDIKKEIITDTKIKESESIAQDVEIKTEYDDDADENSDSGVVEEDVEMKTEIVENEILPLLKSTQSLQSVDFEIMKDGGTLSSRAKNLLQDIDQGLTTPIVNRTSTYPINTTTMPILKREIDESVQTDRVIVLSQNDDGSAGSINPEECRCKRNDYLDMTRPQFYKACSQFLSANFANTVKLQMHLDSLSKHDGNKLNEASSNGSVEAGAAECVEETADECGGVMAPDVVVPGTLSEKPLQHDSSTQTVESIQYVDLKSEHDVSILYVVPNIEKSSTTMYTQTEDSLPYDIKHVNKKGEIITHKISESVKQDVEIKTENDEDVEENSDSGAFEEDVEMKTEIVEDEILPLLKSMQTFQSDTTTTPILTREINKSIQTDRVIVSRLNADGTAGTINPEECSCDRNEYFDMNRLQFYKACSKFLSAEFAITIRRRMHLDDVVKAESSCIARRSRTRAPECVELNATECGDVVAPAVVIASTGTATDSAETDLDTVDRVEASAAASTTECAQRLVNRDMSEMPEDQGLDTALHSKRMRMWQLTNVAPAPPPPSPPPPTSSPSAAPPPSPASFSVPSLANTPLIELGVNQNTEGPILITSALELTNTPPVSIRPEQELDKCILVEPERPAACDLDKKNWDVTGNDHSDHVMQGVSYVSPPGSLQSIFRPISEASGVTVKKRKRNRIRHFVDKVAEGSDFDSDLEDDFDLDEISYTGASIARNIPDDDDLDESVSKIINSIERVMDDAIDQLVGVPNDFNWYANFDTFQGVPEQFSGPTPGPIEDYDTPYGAFTAIWSNDIIEHIVIETNRYAKQVLIDKMTAGTLKPSSRLRCWTDTDKDEIYIFFALHILMGLDQRTTQKEYWKCTGYLEMPKFRKLMKYKRFLLLNRFLHFESVSRDLPQSEGIPLTATWRKIAPIIGHLNNKFSNLYNLHADIAIDESLIKGRFSWGQAIRSKTAWNGMKSYELYDSSTGYLYKFEIYTEKNSKKRNFASLSEALAKKSTQVVMDLLTGLETRGHCITMDNFCNSPALARHLKSLGFDCLGTLRPNRKHVPFEIKNVSKNVAKGTTIARHCGDVSCIAWKDIKMVTMISTYHTSETCIDDKAGQELVKPIVVRDYNKTMKGVNLKDKKHSMYLFERKRIKRSQKWYMKIFMRLLNVSVCNAFILLSGSLNRRGMPLCTDRDFREVLANSLLANRPQLLEEISAPIEEKYTRLRKDILHVPKYHTNVADRWRCFICSRKGIQKMVYSSCVTCNEFICFEGCWSDWHSLQKLPSRMNISCRKRKRSE